MQRMGHQLSGFFSDRKRGWKWFTVIFILIEMVRPVLYWLLIGQWHMFTVLFERESYRESTSQHATGRMNNTRKHSRSFLFCLFQFIYSRSLHTFSIDFESEREKNNKIDKNLISDPVRSKVVTPLSS
jgi:hypothetical protein